MKCIETADILKQVGKRIRKCRQLNGITQADDLHGRYNGSVLSAVIRYLEQIAYDTTNDKLNNAACSVLRQLILCQVVEALWETGGQI